MTRYVVKEVCINCGRKVYWSPSLRDWFHKGLFTRQCPRLATRAYPTVTVGRRRRKA